ncbi:MAG TPA: alpha/beta hydrolase [Amycolatopsis sp.]|uniref:alpha/beta fold hydrolase n=1 Tax=Amycolatopsis sp. TaxID=37632 RepID=UPI002B4A390E|nr:alpha/beta hydrolase [Amycolatopsis sp.]HKS43818.1 alpha/beta hydrolase [Amycolatopsis sp.]
MQMTVNGLSFHVIDEGTGPPVLLLHGFPDSSAVWRHQIPALVAAGHRVIAPDLRGFGESDRPEGVGNYRLELAVQDVLGILTTLGVSRVNVVGHDWGATLAWTLAGVAPEVVERLVVLSVGHPSAYFTDQIRQRELAWYVLFFQYADIAEESLRRDDWALFRLFVRGDGDVDRNLADLSRPGALTAGLNWYRANFSPASFGQVTPPHLPSVGCSVLGVWSDHDHALGEAQMLASEKYVTGAWRYVRLERAGHCIPLAAPEKVIRLLVEFLDDY